MGPSFFNYYLGYAHALRGNNSAAIREIGLAIDSLEATYYQGQPLPIPILSNITILLWYVSMNLKANNAVMKILWSRLASMWYTCIPPTLIKTPFEELCSMIAYTITALTKDGGIPAAACLPLQLMEYESLNTSHSAVFDNKEYDPVINRESLGMEEDGLSRGVSFGSSIWNMFNKSTKTTDGITVPIAPPTEPAHLPTFTTEEFTRIFNDQLRIYEEIMNGSGSTEGESGDVLWAAMDQMTREVPQLLQYKRTLQAHSATDVNASSTSTKSEKDIIMRQFTIPLTRALASMCMGEYKAASEILMGLQYLIPTHLGSTVVHHAILDTTVVEA